MIQDKQITDPALRLRMEWANTLAFVLGECHPSDAAVICAAFLETVETSGPVLGDPFGMVASDARLWAAAAPPHELAAYTLAGLHEIPHALLSVKTRKRIFAALWRSFTNGVRRAFLARYEADQAFKEGYE